MESEVRVLTPEIKLQIQLLVLEKYKDEEISKNQIEYLTTQWCNDWLNGGVIEGLVLNGN